MDIIKFNNPSAPTRMEHGVIINGIKKKLWIERFAEAGEFTFNAPASAGVHLALPIGSFITHTATREIMIVENHEVNADKDSEPQVTVTGRSFETLLEQRTIGANNSFPVSDALENRQYVPTFLNTWKQIEQVLKDHTMLPNVVRPGDQIPFLEIFVEITAGNYDDDDRIIPKGQTVYEAVQKLMALEKMGIRTIRPTDGMFLGDDALNTTLLVHTGVDRRDTVVFSYDVGEIVSADYFWSNRTLKNAAYVTGKWVETYISSGATGINRRIMHVDASDIDEAYATAPVGVDILTIQSAMQQRGLEMLLKQKPITLTKAEPSQGGLRYVFRKDFEVGDIVRVEGDYNQVSDMKVVEYVEIEDETGDHSYPTLELLEDDVVPE